MKLFLNSHVSITLATLRVPCKVRVKFIVRTIDGHQLFRVVLLVSKVLKHNAINYFLVIICKILTLSLTSVFELAREFDLTKILVF